MENFALMSLLDSTPTSKAAFATGLANAQAVGQSTTSDPTASEHWPYGKTVPGGDQTTFGKLIGLDPRTNVPSTQAAIVQLGAIMPVADVWTGDPSGVRWNLPTAAVQNAAGNYVVPSAGAAKAAETGATLASTSDPTTDNLVTFNANTTDPTGCAATDACPYNNWLMLESYLVVPTNGLPTDKALALAQFIRFAVGRYRTSGHRVARCGGGHPLHGDGGPRRGAAARCPSSHRFGLAAHVDDDHQHAPPRLRRPRCRVPPDLPAAMDSCRRDVGRVDPERRTGDDRGGPVASGRGGPRPRHLRGTGAAVPATEKGEG